MEDENRGGAGVATLAPGIDGTIPVKLRSGEVVVVRRWSWTKSLLVMKLFEGAWSQLVTLKIEGADLVAVRGKIMEILGDSAIDLARISMNAGDAAKITGEDFEDVVDAVNASLDLNLTEAIAKKLLALTGKLTRVFPAGA